MWHNRTARECKAFNIEFESLNQVCIAFEEGFQFYIFEYEWLGLVI